MDRFVVGSGRCGSTLLSAMLAEDEALLSVSEFFVGLDRASRFDGDWAPPERFAEILRSGGHAGLDFARRGILLPEIRYPYGAPGSRHRFGEATPWLLQIALAALSEQPDVLFDQLLEFARALPRQTLADQYRAVFRWLAEQRGATAWVERSGSSLEYVDQLIELFPRARFLHLHRDGRESALSMREHAAFRYRVARLYDLPDRDGVRYSFLREYDPSQGVSDSPELTGIIAARAPVEYYGRYWSDQITHGQRALERLDARQLMVLAFEDPIDDTLGSLEAIADFFEFGGDRRAAHQRAAVLVKGEPGRRFPALAPAAQSALAAACRPGMEVIGQVCR